MNYRITTQRQLRREFWEMNPKLSRRKLPDKSYRSDTRVRFVEFIDWLQKDGDISQELAGRATL
jgi:hypothetical protein